LFFTDLTRNPYFTQIVLLQAGVCLIVLLFVALAVRRGGFVLFPTRLDVPLAVLFLWAVVTWGWSWWTHPPFRLPVWNEGKRVLLFLVWNGLAAYGISARLKSEEWDSRFRRIFYVVGVIAGGYGVLQYMGRDFIWATALNPYNGRPVSTFGNPNFLSSYVMMLLPLSLMDGFRAKTAGKRLFFGAVFLLFAAAVVCTMTRSSWIGSVAAVAVFLWFARRSLWSRRRWLGLVFGAAFLAIVFWPSSPLAGKSQRPVDRLRELVAGVTKEKSYGSWHQRLMIWSCAWDMVKERPVVGKGFGCFELFYPFYQGRYLSDRVFTVFRTHANNAHNVILEIWSQAGTVGMGLFFWLCLLSAVFVWKRMPALSEEGGLELGAVFAAVVGMMVDNFFGNVSVFFAVPAFLFWWLMGWLGRTVSPPETRTFLVRRPLVLAALLAATLVSAGGAVSAYRAWRAEIAYFSGFKKSKQGDVRGAIEATERSHSYRRWEVNNNYELANAYARQARWAMDHKLAQESRVFSEKALWAYAEALSANAGYDEIYFNRAAVLNQMERIPEAVLNYRMALLINPLSVEAYRALGNLFLTKEGYFTGAEDLYQRALFYFPRDKEFWNNLGYVYTRLKRYEKAQDAYANALKLDLQFVLAAKNLQFTVKALGQTDHPLFAVPRLWGEVERAVAAKRWEEALRAGRKLEALVPENTRVRLMLADVLAQSGGHAGAMDQYRLVLSWEPGNWEARRGLARVSVLAGRKAEAVRMFRELLAERPGDRDVTDALRGLGESVLSK
ncbi:MAG TPA: O-antigen ligase family protein, partial [Elusimicrobiota bacterium]|nr:O-antigen ligase family protein [Elusimicrobiota bacterium]